ncbi:hypothetical protein [uncultured Polaribacter sp.]|uniref:hypothetical protein n=1 Tax=uncultured Polaribacter sp. TaxID=174711 RepID=UPI0026060E05|nr:hypothetical protein [uncultured Polaribacter sp.]
MKKGVLILLGMIMMVSTVEAKNGNELPNRFGFNYSYNEAVNFVERGIEFFVFTNGEFDFNTHYNDTYFNYGRDRGVRIDRDYRGRISRIGNAFINYDRSGNVTRIGNVFIRYYRGQLTNVGNLRVRYNYWGNPIFYGTVKNNYYNHNGFRINLNIGDIFNYNDAYFYRSDFRRNYSKIREDKNYYYYRANPNAKIGKRSKTLRRRKPASTILKNTPKQNTRRSNSTYRKPTSVNTDKKITRENTSSRRATVKTNRNSNTINKTERNVNRKPSTTGRTLDKKTKRKVVNKNERKRRS